MFAFVNTVVPLIDWIWNLTKSSNRIGVLLTFLRTFILKSLNLLSIGALDGRLSSYQNDEFTTPGGSNKSKVVTK
jgi:hypothetical protein